MANLIIPVGVPGCGKSTWARTFLDRKYRIVSSDEIRLKMFGSLRAAFNGSEEQVAENKEKVFKAYYDDIELALKHNVDVYADATNLRKYYRERLSEIADKTGAKTHVFLFRNLSTAAYRNLQRDFSDQVPREAMDSMYDKWYEAEGDIPFEVYDSVTVIEDFD